MGGKHLTAPVKLEVGTLPSSCRLGTPESTPPAKLGKSTLQTLELFVRKGQVLITEFQSSSHLNMLN